MKKDVDYAVSFFEKCKEKSFLVLITCHIKHTNNLNNDVVIYSMVHNGDQPYQVVQLLV